MKKAFFIIAFICIFFGCNDKKNENQNEQNQTATIGVNHYQAFNLYLEDGSTLAVQKTADGLDFGQNNKIILFNFVTNDCMPCNAQNYNFSKLANKYNNLIVIEVPNFINKKEDALSFKESNKLEFHVAYGENNDYLLKAITPNIAGYPFSALYDHNGNLVQSYDGLVPPEMVEADIKRSK